MARHNDGVAGVVAGAASTAARSAGDGSGQDTLSIKQLAQQQGITDEFIKAHPELIKLFRQAIDENWLSSDTGKAKFQNALSQTAWFKENSTWARQYLFARQQGGEAFAEQERTARQAVQSEAVRIGATLDDASLAFFTEQYLMNGWYDSGRKDFLTKALAGEYQYTDGTGKVHAFNTDHLDYQRGGAATLISNMRATAAANGLTFSDGYYQSAARSILAGLRNEDDFLSEIRGHAASLYPAFSQRVLAGENVTDIASPYTATMEKILELPPGTVKLDDPKIKSALGNTGPDGKFQPVSLWDFEKSLRQDPRWQYTRDAHERVGNLVSNIGRMFGFTG